MRAFTRFSAAGCLTLLVASWALATSAPTDAVRWEPDFETAVHKAAQQNRLVLVHFWNDGCPPCVMVDRQVFPSPQVAEAVHASYIPVKVHAGERADLARRYGVEQWPTDVFLSPAGERVAAYISPKTPQDYSDMVSHIAAREQGRLAASAGQAQAAARVAQAPASNSPGASDRNSAFTAAAAPAAPGRSSYEVQAGGEFPLSDNRAANTPPANGYSSPYLPGGSIAQQPFPPQLPNSAPPMNPFSQNPNPYLAIGSQPAANAAQNSANAPWNAQNYGGPAMNQQGTPAANPQGGLGNPALNQNSGWPPNIPSGQGPSIFAGNSPAQVGQPPLNSPYGGFQQAQPQQAMPQASMPPAMQSPPPISAAPPGQQVAPSQQSRPAGPKFALDGYCAVSLVEQLHLPVNQQQWRRGDPRWGAEHRGQVYLFAGPAEQQKFLANPDYYTPVLSGYDPVVFVEQNQLIEGRREHGFAHDGRVYMFSSEQNLQKFWSSRDMFISRVQQALNTPASQQRR